jgi:acetylornithine deacetylase/succinyl-diaminopimelate desuccinylase-like protein
MARCASVLAVLIGCLAPAQEPPQALARELLREMIETDTTGEHGDTTPLANALAARFRKTGFPAEDIQGLGPQTRHCNLVVRLRGSGRARPILVISHLDVVEAKPEDWTVPPFKLTEKDGWLYGRGTQDIKGEGAAEAAAFLQLKQEGIVPKRDFILALTTGEEGGTFQGPRVECQATYNLGDHTHPGRPCDQRPAAAGHRHRQLPDAAWR